ncbi:MAG: hypothetical protein ABIH41_05825, partial [Nanoarchaeota archaeon]
MRDFLRRIFAGPKQPAAETVNEEDLESWITSRSETMLTAEREQFYQSAEALLTALSKQADELEGARINAKVQVQNKVKNIVVGHRANYVRELRRFIEANRFYKGDIHSFLVDLQSLR